GAAAAWGTATAVVTTTTAACTTWTATGTGACAGTTTTRAGPSTTGAGPCPTGTTGRSGTGCGTWGHIARRHAGPRGTGTRCLRTRNRPLNRLSRGERVVTDARGTRGRLRRRWRRAWPRTWRRAGGRSRGGRCLHRRRDRSHDRRFRGRGGGRWCRGSRWSRGLGGGRLLGCGLCRGGLGRRAVAFGFDLLGGSLRAAEGFAQSTRDGCLHCGGR
ncbi:MAG: hypothetical protein JWQ31_3605, partial [Mycobacterium sp.]|nr:hypothetical protein [Mycobacterium sp.]